LTARPRRLVTNASPLIFLAKIDALSLLEKLADEVAVPSAVVSEVFAGDDAPQALRQIDSAAWLRVEPDLPVPPEIAGWDLGPGETQVLAFAVANPGWEAVLDDLEARECARTFGVPKTGTLGIILRAKMAGLIPAARPLVEDLLRKGAYLSTDLVRGALAEVGE